MPHDVGSVSSAAFLPWSASWASSCGGVGMWGMAQVWRPQLWDEPQSCVGLGPSTWGGIGKEGVRGGCAVWGCRWESPGLLWSETFAGAAHENETAHGVGPGPRRW